MADLLVVDDDSDVAETLSEVLRERGHKVRIATNGAEGLAVLEAHRPDAVLLDVEMPVLSGPEMAYQMFVRDCGLERIPIVLISGILDLPSVARVVKTPYFLAKPFLLDEVLDLVDRVLREQNGPGARGEDS